MTNREFIARLLTMPMDAPVLVGAGFGRLQYAVPDAIVFGKADDSCGISGEAVVIGYETGHEKGDKVKHE